MKLYTALSPVKTLLSGKIKDGTVSSLSLTQMCWLLEEHQIAVCPLKQPSPLQPGLLIDGTLCECP